MNTRFAFLLFASLLLSLGCKKEAKTSKIEYQLDTSSLTGDHFFVTYINEYGDTITEHQHPGWRFAMYHTRPFSAYLKTDVNPIDSYEFTTRIVVDGTVVKETTGSTASGARQVTEISYDSK